MENSPVLRVGTLAHSEMLTGSHARRRALLARAEEGGLDHVFMADHVSFHTGLGMDGLIQAATAAALAPGLGVYVGVYLLALRHPVPVARQIASLAQSAPGQLILGVGVGGEDRREIEVCGVDPATRGRRTDECLEILRRLLSGKPASFSGEFFALDDALILPAPNPSVPIVIGGRAEAALGRAARWGDGWLGIWSTPQRYAATLARIGELARAAGRTTEPSRNGIQLWAGADDDRDRARQRLGAAMTNMYRIPFERFEKYSPYGTPAEIADFLVPYVEAGCREFNLMVVAENTEAEIDAVTEIRRRLVEGG
jgi:alkanesulfonate monooxygenase SsuD/methylene tetrahydromethanopterin reductase-like flavin-dependent oxidoreductase (luciferase family)